MKLFVSSACLPNCVQAELLPKRHSGLEKLCIRAKKAYDRLGAAECLAQKVQ